MTGVPDLVVVVVTYNSVAFIDECLHAVPAACGTASFRTVVVDNASADGTAEHIRRSFPDVTVIDMGGNAGFARANNRAIAAVDGRAYVLLNGDAVPRPGSLETLLSTADGDPRAGIVAPLLLNPDGTDQGTARAFPTPVAAVFGRRSPLTRLFPDNRWSRAYLVGRHRSGTAPFEVDWVSGACMLVPRRVIEAVGPLDEGFFMYWEDADWCRRARSGGYATLCVPAAEVVHDEGSSSGGGWAPRQTLRFHRSAYRYYAKHHLAGARAPFRPLAAAVLGARATAVVARDALVRRAHRGVRAAGPIPRKA